jgi:hypothetical protein
MEIIEYNLNGVTIKKTDRGLSWRLIHDGIQVVELFESAGITETPINLFISTTEAECQAEIDRLGLTPLQEISIDPELPEEYQAP